MESPSCYVCNKCIGQGKSHRLSAKTRYSETILHDLLQSFLDDTHILRFSAYDCVCNECFQRLNKYDLAYRTANGIRQDILNAFHATDYESLGEELVYSDSDESPELDNETECQQKDYEADKVYMETVDGDAIEYDGESPKKTYQRGRSRCADCHETFNTQNELKRHRLKFHVAKKCGVCQEVFANQYDLRLHARLVHEVENDSADESAADTSRASETDGMADSMLRCSICGIVEQTTESLEEHKASHDNSLKCTICGVVVKHKSNLILHMRIHTDKKFFKCDKCEKTFVHKSSLRMHLQTTHSDVKSKECSHCPMKFKTTSQLNQHLVTHSGEKRHECPVCGKAFSQKYNMTAHHRSTHLSQKSPRKPQKSTQ